MMAHVSRAKITYIKICSTLKMHSYVFFKNTFGMYGSNSIVLYILHRGSIISHV